MKIKLILFGALAAMLLAGCNDTTDTPDTPEPKPEQYAVWVAEVENGEVSVTVDDQPITQAAVGTEITVTATPDEGCQFAGWTVIGATLTNSAAETTTFKMPESDITIEAKFNVFPPDTYGITVMPTVNGTVTVTADGVEVERAAAGTEIVITATPDVHHTFVEWMVTGADPDDVTAESTIFTMPEGDVTITTRFHGDPYIEEGVVIGGIKWSTRNVDAPGTFAATPESPGMFYQYGRDIGWSIADPMVSHAGGTVWNTAPYMGKWTAESDPCPEGWRVPTFIEIGTLCNTTFLTHIYTESPVPGIKITEKDTGNSIFLPICGMRAAKDGALSRIDGGVYWGTNTSSSTGSGKYYLYFDQYDQYGNVEVTLPYTFEFQIAMNIRPIAVE